MGGIRWRIWEGRITTSIAAAGLRLASVSAVKGVSLGPHVKGLGRVDAGHRVSATEREHGYCCLVGVFARPRTRAFASSVLCRV